MQACGNTTRLLACAVQHACGKLINLHFAHVVHACRMSLGAHCYLHVVWAAVKVFPRILGGEAIILSQAIN